MGDLVFVSLLLVFFVVAGAFVRACGWIGERGGALRERER